MPHLSKQTDELSWHRVGQNLVPESVAGIWSITLSARLTLHNYCVHPEIQQSIKMLKKSCKMSLLLNFSDACESVKQLWHREVSIPMSRRQSSDRSLRNKLQNFRTQTWHFTPSLRQVIGPHPLIFSHHLLLSQSVQSFQWSLFGYLHFHQLISSRYLAATGRPQRRDMSSPAKSLGWPSKSKGNPIGRSNQ